MLEEFRQRLKTVETRLRAPSAKSHDGKSKAPSTRPPQDCFNWTKHGHCGAHDKGSCRFKHDEAKKGSRKAKDSKDADSSPDGKTAPLCALKECNKPCPWDPQAGKFWKFCTQAHKKEQDKHVACPAIISVHDPGMHAEQILAGTRAYVTPVVPLESRDLDDIMKMTDKADEIAVTLFDEGALRTIDWSNPDDVEEVGNLSLIAAFEQVLGKQMTTTDAQNITQSWRPGIISAEDVAEICRLASIGDCMALQLLGRGGTGVLRMDEAGGSLRDRGRAH